MAPGKRKNTGKEGSSRKGPTNTKHGKTSPAALEHRGPTFSLHSLLNIEDEKDHERDFFRLNGKTPETHATWGRTGTGAISAIKSKKKGLKAQNYFSGLASIGPLFGKNDQAESTLLIPNSPDRSPLLGFPVEVREKIYGFLLADPKPIVVGPDWESVQGRVLRYNALQYVCKQLGEEASKFVYNENVFLALLRTPRKSSAFDEALFIDTKFLSLFRNVVINCPMENWTLDWHEKAAHSVDKLVAAKAALASITIVVSPTRATGSSSTALGIEANPLCFADFFYYQGPLMTSIRKLQCKVFNIIIKKRLVTTIGQIKFTSGVKRLLISVDLTYLHAEVVQSGFANEETMAIAREKATTVKHELQGLKHRFEAIFEDHETAIQYGICRELSEEEKITDGMALARRK